MRRRCDVNDVIEGLGTQRRRRVEEPLLNSSRRK